VGIGHGACGLVVPGGGGPHELSDGIAERAHSEFDRGIDSDAGAHGSIDALVRAAAFELGHVRRGGDHEGEVRAGRVAVDRDPVGVDAERVGVGAHPAEGSLHIVYLRGLLRFAREAVGSGDADVTEAAKEDAVAPKLGGFALRPAAAVDEEDTGSVPGGAGRREDVVAELAAVDGVDEDVFLDGDARRIRWHGLSPGKCWRQLAGTAAPAQHGGSVAGRTKGAGGEGWLTEF